MIGFRGLNIDSDFWDSLIENSEVMYWINDNNCIFLRHDIHKA